MQEAVKLRPAVLVIEDEDTQRALLVNKLEKLGYSVTAATNGQQGLDLWANDPMQLRIVLTDLHMPGASGFDVVKTIRAQESTYTYVMILTTAQEKENFIEGLRCGGDDFVIKPIINEELQLRMQGAMRMLRLQDHTALVTGLAELAAERSGETSAHLKKTREYCRILGLDMVRHCPDLGLTEQYVEDIADLCVLHDIGKNGIPDGLLYKRGRITPQEQAIIHNHTNIGGNILQQLYEQSGSIYLLIGYEIAMYHHEKWDGSGYPRGLKGDEIPLAARITAFADVFDALLSRRSYKDPFSLSHAEVYIFEQKGRHFDPRVVESYERNRDRFMEIHNAIPEPVPSW